MWRRGVLVGVVAVAAVGAGEVPRSVSVEDPCGDFVTFAPQPDDWDRNDLAGLSVVEVRDEADDATVLGVDVVVEMCADAVEPDRPGEYLNVSWPLGDGCRAQTIVGAGPDPVYVVGDVGVPTRVLTNRPRFAVRCHEPIGPWGLVATHEERAGVELVPERLRRDGRTVTIELRAAELGELSHHVTAGTTIDGARAISYVTYGTMVVFGSSTGGSGGVGVVDWTDSAGALTLGG